MQCCGSTATGCMSSSGRVSHCSVAYLPDFYLPQQGIWVEVKGPPPSFAEEDLCQCLAVETRQPVIIAWGQPSWETVVICFTPDGDRQLISLAGFLLRWASVNTLAKAINAARSARWEHGESPNVVAFPPAKQITAS
jgi:hypothetical protein